jgi:CubicO group peptidase (beta-lactamase class C family)
MLSIQRVRLLICHALPLLSLLCFAILDLSPQDSSGSAQIANLSVIVNDASGAVIPNAEVGFQGEKAFLVKTGQNGSVQVPLPYGSYATSVTSRGFKTTNLGSQVQGPEAPDSKVVLEVGHSGYDGSTVEVFAAPAVTSDVPNTIEPKLTLSLSVRSLAQVSPAQINSIFSPLKSTSAPGAAVLVIRDGKAIYRRGYGITDLRTLHPIDARTNFRLASFTKQFTAACIMLLARDGKLHYDDHLTDFFPEFPAYGKSITVRNLLNHTSGLEDYGEIMMTQYSDTPPEKIPQILDAGVLKLLEQQTGARFPAGTKWEYSNSGYAVLAMIVEKVSDRSFGAFLQERIFTPLKMKNTLAYEKGKNEVPDRAYGYSKKADGWHETDQSPTSAVLGDGGIYSSVDDLTKWDRALRDHTLLSAAEMQPALTPVQPASSPAKDENGRTVSYGFGWFLDPYQGHKRFSHNGSTIGFGTTIQRFPDDQLTVIVLANRTDINPDELALKVADLYVGTKP